MSRIAGCSMSTVHQAYGLLENAGIFIALPRSGFYIDENARPPANWRSRLDVPSPDVAHEISISELTLRLFASWSNSEIQQFGAIYPSTTYFPSTMSTGTFAECSVPAVAQKAATRQVRLRATQRYGKLWPIAMSSTASLCPPMTLY